MFLKVCYIFNLYIVLSYNECFYQVAFSSCGNCQLSKASMIPRMFIYIFIEKVKSQPFIMSATSKIILQTQTQYIQFF